MGESISEGFQGHHSRQDLPGETGRSTAEYSRRAASLAETLRQHSAVCHELLKVIQEEHRSLTGEGEIQSFEFHQRRRLLLPRLDESLTSIRRQVTSWQEIPVVERSRFPELAALLRSTQDLVMRVIVMDRENEQVLLRRGLVPPRHVPAAQRQQPHFVAELYRRNHQSPA